jgi:hypothetical protein
VQTESVDMQTESVEMQAESVEMQAESGQSVRESEWCLRRSEQPENLTSHVSVSFISLTFLCLLGSYDAFP